MNTKHPIKLDKIPWETEAEEILAYVFNGAQIKGIQNLLLDIVHEKLNLPCTTEHQADFFLRQEYLRGQYDILRYLLSCHDLAEDKYKDMLVNQHTQE